MKKKGRKRRRKKPVTQFLTDDVIMTSTVDAVDLKIAALHEARGTRHEARGTRHDVRYTVSVLHVCEAGGYSVSCWVGVSHWDTETLTL